MPVFRQSLNQPQSANKRRLSIRQTLVPAPQEALDDLLLGLEDSLGIAMIVAAAPAVDYKTTFGVNNLTIIL